MTIRALLLATLLTLLGGCSLPPQPAAVEGTLAASGPAGGRGLGGTGRQWVELERGLGGTGLIGTIRAFGSIWVNGVEVEYDDRTAIMVNGQPATATALRLGQQVVAVTTVEEQRVYATELAIDHPLIGTVEAVGERQLTLLGEVVQLAADAPTALAPPPVGSGVRVSGYRDSSGQLIATDLEPITTEVWQIQFTTDASGQIDSSLSTRWRQPLATPPLQPESRYRISGHTSRPLEPPQLERLPLPPSTATVRAWLIEGSLIQRGAEWQLRHAAGQLAVGAGQLPLTPADGRGVAFIRPHGAQPPRLEQWQSIRPQPNLPSLPKPVPHDRQPPPLLPPRSDRPPVGGALSTPMRTPSPIPQPNTLQRPPPRPPLPVPVRPPTPSPRMVP